MYAQHFGLQSEPFGLTPDPAFLYPSAGHREALAALQIGIEGRRGLIVMVGEVGTGKTTLLYSLLPMVTEQAKVAYITNTKLNFEEILAQALADFGVKAKRRSRAAMLAKFREVLLECAREGTVAVLVIDEAQNLDEECLENIRLLSNVETFTDKLLQIVLVGQPELMMKLARPNLRQLRERIAVYCEVKPLSWRDSRAYVAHRLQQAGGSIALFTSFALALILWKSRGIPRRINILSHNAMLFAYGNQAANVSFSAARTALRAGLLQHRRLRSASVDLRRALSWGRQNAGSALHAARGGLMLAVWLRLSAYLLAASVAVAALWSVPAFEAHSTAPVGNDSLVVANAGTKPQIVRVPAGASLSDLVTTFYGRTDSDLMARVRSINPKLGQEDEVTEGQVIILPPMALIDQLGD